MKDYLLFKNAPIKYYAASVAATWIWAPALYVSSAKSYADGLTGLMIFLIPNALTLVLFAYIVAKIREQKQGLTVGDAIAAAGKPQVALHTAISTIVLLCSTVVQFIGIYALAEQWLSKTEVFFAISAVAILTVWRTGLKGSIITDYYKYIIMLLGGIFLCCVAVQDYTFESAVYTGRTGNSKWHLLSTFGITSTIGLLAAPYADQTFWQRVWSIEPREVKKVFSLAAALFFLIPLLFGITGFLGKATIVETFAGNSAARIVLAVCVLAALLSTIDSNACAAAAFTRKIREGKLAMIALLALAGTIFVNTEISITEMFLLYGTIRTVLAIPTILIILGMYDRQRLFWATLFASIICTTGYIASGGNFLFTVGTLLIPLVGYKR